MAKLVRKKRKKHGKIQIYWAVRTRRGSEFGAGYDKRIAERLRDHYTGLEILEANGVPLPSASDWLVEDLRAYDLAAHAREGGETDSRRRRWDVLERFFAAKKAIDAIDRDAIGGFIAARQAQAGPATIRRDLSVLKTALGRARQPEAQSGYEKDPFAGIPSMGKKERRARAKTPKFRPDLVEAVIAAAWEVAGEQPPYVRPGEWRQNAEILELIYRTKSRVEQVCELRRDQVRPHPNRPGARVLWFPPDKNGDERFFEYQGRIRQLLEAIPDDGSGLFFPSQRGGDHRESPRRRFLQRAIARAQERLDAPELAALTLRSLRKSKACADLARGKKPVEVQAELGHKSLATTMDWYAEVFPHVGPSDRPSTRLSTPRGRKRPHGAPSAPGRSADSRGNARARGRASVS